ncbi:hypothetical protein D3C79_620690 [compost metagenome]
MVHPVHEQGAPQDVEEVDEGAAHLDGEHEHQVHHQQEEGDAHPAVEQRPVQPLALGDRELALLTARLLAPVMDVAIAQISQLQIDVLGVVGTAHHVASRRLLTRRQRLLHGDVLLQQAQGTATVAEVMRGKQGLELGDVGFQRLAVIEHQGGLGLADEPVDLLLEGRHLLAIVGRERHHRATERLAEQPLVYGDAALLQQIHLVEHHHHGQAQLPQLQGEIEGAFQIGGVDDVEQQIRLLALHEAAGDLLVQARLLVGQGIDAGQVHQLIVMTGGGELAHLLVDGDPAPVAHLLAGTGQGVEQRGLAAVGVAYGYQGVVHTGSTSICWARLFCMERQMPWHWIWSGSPRGAARR